MLPQILYIVLSFVGLLIAANKHGKQVTKKESFWASLIAAFLMYALLLWGGFFDPILRNLPH